MNLVLYGMMGVGKSTVARLLATELGRAVADTDTEIERWTGRDIPAIFREDGEAAFRDLENRVVRELSAFDDLVIATGGGTVLRDDNVADLSLTGVLIHLDAPVEVLVERLDGADGRPLLDGDVATRVREVHAARADRYAQVADLTIDAAPAPDVVVASLLDWLSDEMDVLTPSEFERLMR